MLADSDGRILLADAAGEMPELGAEVRLAAVGRSPGALVAVDYEDLGQDWFGRGVDPERRKANLVKQLQDLGYAIVLRPAA